MSVTFVRLGTALSFLVAAHEIPAHTGEQSPVRADMAKTSSIASDPDLTTHLFERVPESDALPEAGRILLSRLRDLRQFDRIHLVRLRSGALRELLCGARVAQTGFQIEVEPDHQVSVTAGGNCSAFAAGFDLSGRGMSSRDTGTLGVSLIVSGDRVTGTISGTAASYAIRPLGGGVHVVARAMRGAIPNEPVRPTINPAKLLAINELGWALDRVAMSAREPAAVRSAGTPTIRVLALVTPPAEAYITAQGSTVDEFLRLIARETNDGFVNSKLRVQVQITGWKPIHFGNEGKVPRNLELLIDSKDKELNQVHEWRAAAKADVVAAIIGEPNTAGWAYTHVDAARAFMIVGARFAAGSYSFAHELGHLLGAEHAPVASPYLWGHGFAHANKWHTIMAYPSHCGNCPRINYWSNPSMRYGGVAMGTANHHHDARVIEERAAIVAGFR